MRRLEPIPAEAAGVLRPVLPELADEMIATIAAEVPDYKRAMEGLFGQMVRLGVETALRRFADELDGAPAEADPQRRETYVNLGRGEFHAGRSLDALLGAYRVGARVAWRRFVEAGVDAGLAPQAIYRLGEAIFEYIDELSAESAEGYAAEQMAEIGERRRRRRRLVEVVAQEPAPGEDEVRLAAEAAGWDLPRRLAALVAVPGVEAGEALDAAADRLGRECGPGAVAATLDGVACVLAPDPDGPGRPRRLAAAVADVPAALGPAVEWPLAPLSLRRALATLRLLRAGRLEGSGLARADDHLGALLLAGDPALARELAARRLAPLEGVAPATRARLTETLRAWLDRPGQIQAIAAVLGVHPQTVRYRVRQLRELFGPALEDPDRRFELALALRVD